jgi:hypothetical protein
LPILEIINSFFSSPQAPAFIITAAGLIVAIIAYVFERKKFKTTQEFEGKRFTTTILIQVIQQLNDIKHREARKVLYEELPPNSSYEILGISLKEDSKINDIKKLASDMVRGDLNEIATLSRHGLIDDSIFIKEFYWIILRVWYEVELSIIERRKDGPSDYMTNFEDLKNKTEDFAKTYRNEDYTKLQKYRKEVPKDRIG